MKFVMNEIKIAEDILKKKKLRYNEVGQAIPLLAKYFYQIKCLNKKQCYDAIVKFMNEACSDYFREADQMFYIDNSIKYAKNIKLICVENIKITKKEMDTITAIGNRPLERLAFVMLCCCKYHMQARNGTSHWVGYEHGDIFRMAKLKHDTTVNEKYFYELCQRGLLTVSGISGKCALKVNYIDEDPNAEIVLTLSNMNDLAYEYLNYIGYGRFIRCKDCGILVKVGKKDTSTCRCKYCQNIESARLNRERVARCRDNKTGNVMVAN